MAASVATGKIGGPGRQDGDSREVPGSSTRRSTTMHRAISSYRASWTRSLVASNASASGAGDEEAVGSGKNRGGNCGDLVGRLALSEDHLGKALSNGAVVIDLCEVDVFVGEVAQPRDHLVDG